LTVPLRPHFLGLSLFGAILVLACSSEPQSSGEADLTENATQTSPGTMVHGTAPRASGGFPSVVILAAETDADMDSPIPTEPAVMDQYNTEFHPGLLLVRAGQKVLFKNSEDTLHNVHVIDIETRDTAFNVATPVTGAFEYVFESPAIYDVSCGIHPSMAAFIVVTDSPYSVTADTNGTFSLTNVPPGTYKVTVWNLDPSRRSEHVVAVEGDATELTLDAMPLG